TTRPALNLGLRLSAIILLLLPTPLPRTPRAVIKHSNLSLHLLSLRANTTLLPATRARKLYLQVTHTRLKITHAQLQRAHKLVAVDEEHDEELAAEIVVARLHAGVLVALLE